MRQAQHGDTVRVHFTCSFDDNTQFASTIKEDPLELTIGDGKMISCLEESVIGMTEGEQRTVQIPPEQAMGPRDPDGVSQLPLYELPEQDEDLRIGSVVTLEDQNRNEVKARVTALTDSAVTVDTNHPLAGKSLTFDIRLVSFV